MNHLISGSGPVRRLMSWVAVVVLSWLFYLLVERHFIASASGRRRSKTQR
jgi:peptidoglycan/LPS O-acetylase OafA/YrhL